MSRPNNGQGVVYGLAISLPLWGLILLAVWLYFVQGVR